MEASDGREILRQRFAVPGLECSSQFVDGLGCEFSNLLGIHFLFVLLEGLLFLPPLGSAVGCQEEEMPFLAAGCAQSRAPSRARGGRLSKRSEDP